MIEQPAAIQDRPDACPFQIALSASPPTAPLAANVLACVCYGFERVAVNDPRIVQVPLGVLEGPGRAEVWSGTAPVRLGLSDGIRHADNGEVLFGWLQLAESTLAPIEAATQKAYADIQRLLERLGFPHWLRVWNYLTDITGGTGDAERYRQFTAGRYRALAVHPHFERQLPAATGIGLRRGPEAGRGLIIYFLASRRPGLQIENPRQTSAFRYPREYGVKSPSFSRATLQHWRDRSVLFLSGTASIVGHATHGAGDANRQLDETLANIDALLAHATQLHFPGAAKTGFTPHSFKVYVRSSEVLAEIGGRLRTELSASVPITVLEGDLCRRDLLLEIEALYYRPTT